MGDRVVATKYGKIRGFERRDMVEFLGIPFAKPPVGELRFKRATEPDAWEGIYDASEYKDPSLQLYEGTIRGSEDCLYLNVQRPLEGDKMPVLVWIHGGGYNTGAACDSLTDGKAFVQDGICFVSIQYRLNVLGFYDFTTYKGCDEFDSNCGFSDQIMALKWVHENISAFGGDPSNVTIMGESAGAASVINMMAAPSVRGYFSKAITQSGLPNCVMTHEMARENIALFLEGMGINEEDIPSLKDIDPVELQKGNTYVAQKHQYINPGMFLPGPVLDDLLPVRPIDAITKGSAEGVKLIIGTNMHEGTMFVHPEDTGFPNSWEMIREMFVENGHADAYEDIKKYYEKFGDDTFVQFATDYAFQMPAIKVALAQEEYGDVYMYRYEFVSESGKNSGLRASHAFEIPAVFRDRDFDFSRFIYDGECDAAVSRLSDDMHIPWASFIQSGKPDAHGWQRYEGEDSAICIFDRKTQIRTAGREDLLNVWGNMRFYE